ncbi:terminase family protein [Sphingorhabdus sp. Alg239-R122]|uniref:DNA-packaging protein n=1 Tax=Sphingorhabdus sp. Alg239-R122 TaxID=2305989 RepID=UPI001F083EC5|nr:terminase family protein [Sphingorhabdus sp. Alg239-R122]
MIRRIYDGTPSIGERLAGADPAALQKYLDEMPDDELRGLYFSWATWGRKEQQVPPGNWRIWMIMAGRGFGKTRSGAEWVRDIAVRDGNARIALVAANMHEARSVMVEGAAGIAAVTPEAEQPIYEPSLRRLRWASGARATLYSAADPDSLRGGEHSHGWCDEIGKRDHAPTGVSTRAEAAWDNLQMGLRAGTRPQVLATTTPRPVPLVQRLVDMDDDGDGTLAITRGTTYANATHLAGAFVGMMTAQYGAGQLGRQELHGELLRDVEGALWSRSLIERCRAEPESREYMRIIIAVDPPASSRGDACGIIAAGLLADGNAHVLADASVDGASPHVWAAAVAKTYTAWKADRVVAEANQGGDMVRSVLQAADMNLPVRLVHARRGKSARAEPVAALYEAGRVFHAGHFGKLEDEMCGLMAGGNYMGPGRSPDRADALVWALTELMLERRVEPRVWAG